MFTIDQVLNDRAALIRLINEHETLKETVQNSPLNFCVYDQNDCLIAWNNAYEELHPEAFSENRKKAENGQLTYEQIIRYQIAKEFPPKEVDREVARRSAMQQHATGEGVVRSYPSVGYIKVCKYRLPSGATAGWAFEINDEKAIQEQLERQARALEQANKDIRELALSDALTGLRNRRYVDEHLPEIIAKAARDGTRVAVLHIDLDRFKPINDTIGHAAGDHILKNTAAILRDVCPACAFIARVGGDEFVVALVGVCEEAEISGTAAEIIDRLSQPKRFQDQICRVGASIGIAAQPASRINHDVLLVQADIALHQAKNEGRNCFRFFNTELQNKLRRKKKLADEIIAGVEQREFFPVFQPQFMADTLDLRGLEVLCRWQHPERGVLEPKVFLEVAKDVGLMSSIDRLLAEKTHTQLQQLCAMGLVIPKIAFNVGSHRLLDPSLVSQLVGLQRLDIDVAIELVESMSLDSLDRSMGWAIDRLKERGVAFEIDDFGSCRASIAGLMSVSPHTMKIDQQIVSPIIHSPPHRKLVRAIIEIGKALDIEVVAEGVETSEHARLLTSLGCHVLQGFALAHPMPIETLLPFLKKRAEHRDKPCNLNHPTPHTTPPNTNLKKTLNWAADRRRG